MSNQLKLLLSQLARTPTTSTKNTKKYKIQSSGTTTTITPSSVTTPVSNLKRKRIIDDSGVDTISSTYIINKNVLKCDCRHCVTRNQKRIELENTLKHAFVNYLRESSEQKFANIPVMVIKSFKPTSSKSIKQLDQINVRKNTAVNALFMKDSKWVYIKTSENVKGFIPKKFLGPFQNKSCENKSKNRTSSPIPKAPDSVPPTRPVGQKNLVDHTYMTINDNDFKTEQKAYADMRSEETDLALLSVSNYIETTSKATKLSKNLISKFIECDSDKKESSRQQRNGYKSNRDIIRVLAKSKSRNRKISIAIRQLSNEATLTMLEHNLTNTYTNLNECNSNKNVQYENTNNFSPIVEESKKRLSSKTRNYFINYENLSSFKSTKRQKSTNSSYDSYSPSSIEYDVISSDYKMTPGTPVNYYSNGCAQGMDFEEDNHVYDHLSSNNSKVLNMFKVVEDYTADFKGDLSVRKGDIVNLIDTVASPKLAKNNDYLFVRIYKRYAKSTPNGQIECQNVQGYIPRSHVTKI